MSVFPATTVADFTTAFAGVLTNNIAVILGILAFMFGIKFIMRLFNRSTKGKLQYMVR